jgi:nucleoside 2-deoxyribosyltransferase
MNKPRIYLAGPISGLSFDEATAWRLQVNAALSPRIEVADPMRGKDALKGDAKLADGYNIHPLMTDKAIFERDLQDVMRADLLLVNLLAAKQVSQGTLYEIAWAYLLRKPTVIVMERRGNLHDHLFLRQATAFRTDNLPEACDIVRGILLV